MTPTPSPRSQSQSLGPLRSRRGCKTCKARRVKCGEEKPTCLRCTSTGRKCEYDGAAVRLGTYSSASAAATSSLLLLDKPRSPSPTNSSSPASSFASDVWRERRAFAYYFQHAATFVGGLDADFWSSVVPQVCRVEPAVWDAIIALSAMFETRETNVAQHGLTLAETRRDALSWYSRSVSAVRARIERGGSDVFVGLISCVLFICIEALQGSTAEALRLYAQGVRLILALRAQIVAGGIPASRAGLLEETIVPIFVRLAIMAMTVSGVAVQELMVMESVRVFSGAGFASLKAAREAMVRLAVDAGVFQEECEALHPKGYYAADVSAAEMIARQTVLLSRLSCWNIAFTALVDSLRLTSKTRILPAQQTATIALLSAYHAMTRTMVSICTSPRKVVTDAYLPNFRAIVQHSRLALDASARSDGTQPPFTFDIGVGFPVWFTCLRCADPGIRREALELLRRAPQVEGFYGNGTITVSAEGVMLIEEGFAAVINTCRNQSPSPGSLDGGIDTSTITMFDVTRIVAAQSGDGAGPSYHPILTAGDIPEEARIKPLVPFKPRDGIPPALTREYVERWGKGPDSWFLVFTRLDRDRGSGLWFEVFDCVPAELEP